MKLKNIGIPRQDIIKEVKSESDPSKTYLLYRKGDKVACTCIGYSVRKTCKHTRGYNVSQDKA